jgi:hypothetical protein
MCVALQQGNVLQADWSIPNANISKGRHCAHAEPKDCYPFELAAAMFCDWHSAINVLTPSPNACSLFFTQEVKLSIVKLCHGFYMQIWLWGQLPGLPDLLARCCGPVDQCGRCTSNLRAYAASHCSSPRCCKVSR